MQRCALQAQARCAADFDRVGGVLRQAEVARGNLEIGIAQLDANGSADIALALQVSGDLFAQAGEHGTQFGTVAHCVQIAVESGFAAHADRLALGDHRAAVAAPGSVM